MKPIEAMRFDDNYIAIDAIADIEISDSYVDTALYNYLGGKRKLTGRIVSFEENCMVVDVSERYCSKQLDVGYSYVASIKDVTKEVITPC